MVTTIPGVSGTGNRLTQHLAHRPVTFVITWLPWRRMSGLCTSTDKQHTRDNLFKIKKSDLQSWKLGALSSAQLSEPLMTQQLLHTLRVLPGNHYGSLFPNTSRAPCSFLPGQPVPNSLVKGLCSQVGIFLAMFRVPTQPGTSPLPPTWDCTNSPLGGGGRLLLLTHCRREWGEDGLSLLFPSRLPLPWSSQCYTLEETKQENKLKHW